MPQLYHLGLLEFITFCDLCCFYQKGSPHGFFVYFRLIQMMKMAKHLLLFLGGCHMKCDLLCFGFVRFLKGFFVCCLFLGSPCLIGRYFIDYMDSRWGRFVVLVGNLDWWWPESLFDGFFRIFFIFFLVVACAVLVYLLFQILRGAWKIRFPVFYLKNFTICF